jgi:threonine/homoserine/homoserine lactone efflux protein
VAVISLSGVMMPGPVTAGTIAKGYKNKNAGMQIAVGHAFVEFPLVAAIGLGLGPLFENREVMIIIGLVGGLVLLYIGYNMIKMRKDVDKTENYLPYHPSYNWTIFNCICIGFWSCRFYCFCNFTLDF